MNCKPKKKRKRNLRISKSLPRQTPLDGEIKKKYPSNKPELKKLLICRFLKRAVLIELKET